MSFNHPIIYDDTDNGTDNFSNGRPDWGNEKFTNESETNRDNHKFDKKVLGLSQILSFTIIDGFAHVVADVGEETGADESDP